MTKMAKKYSEYGFEKHMGYGTKMHREAIQRHSPSPIHRKSFLKLNIEN
jgi:ribonuclease HII